MRHLIQKKILTLLDKEKEIQTSLRGLGRKIEEPHPQKIKYHLRKLENKGFLNTRKISRGNYLISLLKDDPDIVRIPILKTAILKDDFIFENANISEFISVPHSFVEKENKKNLFCIKMPDQSMNRTSSQDLNLEEGIEEGDYILFTNQVKDLEINSLVIVYLHQKLTVRKYKESQNKNYIVLAPKASFSIAPTYLENKKKVLQKFVKGKVLKIVPKE
jgi:SOS-response transcriptional repressor LexA